jgi:DNA-directed RNA polymerase specialized sigma24 family protein
MRWLEQLSRSEIASALGVSRATVNNQLTHAMRVMREKLTPE